jgi:transposase
LIEALKSWLESRLTQIRGGSPTAEAIRYTLSRWTGLTRFLDDGRIELDNNAVERAMRPIALNRKNSLFAGSDEGAHHWAILATLVECCKLHAVNPQAYFEDVLTRLVNGHPQSQIGQLTPWALRATSAG